MLKNYNLNANYLPLHSNCSTPHLTDRILGPPEPNYPSGHDYQYMRRPREESPHLLTDKWAGTFLSYLHANICDVIGRLLGYEVKFHD